MSSLRRPSSPRRTSASNAPTYSPRLVMVVSRAASSTKRCSPSRAPLLLNRSWTPSANSGSPAPAGRSTADPVSDRASGIPYRRRLKLGCAIRRAGRRRSWPRPGRCRRHHRCGSAWLMPACKGAGRGRRCARQSRTRYSTPGRQGRSARAGREQRGRGSYRRRGCRIRWWAG